MTFSKNMIRGLVVLAIILVVFSMIVFVVPFPKTLIFWIAYVFGLAAIGVQAYALYAAFVKGDNARSKLYGFPIARIGSIYMIFQLVASLIFMALAAVLPWSVPVVISVVALAAAVIGLISSEAVREEVVEQEVTLKKDVSTMRQLQSKAATLAGQCSQVKALQDLSSELRYSDPVSKEELAGLEGELVYLLDELQFAVTNKNNEAVQQLSQKALAVLKERNQLCKLSK